MAKKKQNNRDDFTPTTVNKLGKRVGFVCSNPGCRIHTVGPNEASDKTSNIGKAAHICAAAENGPRYDPNMTPAQRSGIDNGIWLCGNCHDIVDTDPVKYPAELLRQWKQQAEDAASNRLGKPVETAAKNVRQFPLQAPAIPLTDFVEGSRDTEIAALRESLEKDGIVFLWGFGGMGKSETAIKLALGMEPKGGVFLMHYQNSMRDTILKLNFDGYKLYATPSTNTPETFAEADLRQRMKMLKEGYRDAILIVDNFDVEGKSLADLQSEPAYQELVTGGFKLIFTTRYPVNRPEWEIRPLTPEYRLKLMRNLSQGIRATDEELLELIDAVDGHTLTLALMAKTLKASLRITPKLMLEALKNNSLDELKSRAVSSDKDRDTTQRRIEAHLATLFDLSKLDDNARTVLACATLLPDGGFEPNLFLDCLPDEQQEALERLTEINWLTLKDGLITIHPVMRQVCRITLKPDDTVCGPFLEELWKQYDEYAYDAKKYQQMAECFAVATDTLGSQNAWYPNHAGRLFCYLGQNDSGLNYFEKAVELVENYDPENGEMLGTVWNDIGYVLGELGNYTDSLVYYEKALQIRCSTLDENHIDLSQSYGNIGSAYSILGDHKNALLFSQKALDILKRANPCNQASLAKAYGNVASEYIFLNEDQIALDFAQESLRICEDVLLPNHPDLASAYDRVGVAHNRLENYELALSFKRKALEIRITALPNNHPDLALSYYSISSTYSKLSAYEEALRYSQLSLTIREAILNTNHPDLAWSYRGVGIDHLNLRHKKDGEIMLLKAKEIWISSLPAGHPNLTLIYNDLAGFYSFYGPNNEARKYKRLARENETFSSEISQ